MKFSIIMPCYNAENFVGQAIQSILAQSYPDFELIIVDDGSTDNSVAIIEKFAKEDQRIALIKTANSGRPSIARNSGIQVAKGDILCFLDADDLYDPDRLKQVAVLFLEHLEFDVIFHDYSRIDPNGDIYITSHIHSIVDNQTFTTLFDSVKGKYYQGSNNLYLYFIEKSSLIHTSAVCIRRERFSTDTLLFPPTLTCAEDLALWSFLVSNGRCAFIDTPLSCYRDTPGSITKQCSQCEYDLYRYCKYISENQPQPIRSETVQILQMKIFQALRDAAYNCSLEGRPFMAMKLYWKAMKIDASWALLLDCLKVPIRIFIKRRA